MSVPTLQREVFLTRLWGHLPRVTRRAELKIGYNTYEEVRVVCSAPEATIMTSEIVDSAGLHAPVLDIDFEASLIPSSTPGHYHLVLEKAMTWKRYRKLIKALGKAQILEEGYVRATLSRGYSSIRLPWVKKR